jgi:hypothetical protein
VGPAKDVESEIGNGTVAVEDPDAELVAIPMAELVSEVTLPVPVGPYSDVELLGTA